MSRSLSTFKNDRWKITIRLIILSLCALIIGILSNQIHNKGIQWKILQLSLPIISGQQPFTYVSVDSAFFLYLQQESAFIDTRIRDDFNIDHIPNAVSLPFREFFNNPESLYNRDKNLTYILYDHERNTKSIRLVARQMMKDGFKMVYVMRGGFVEWLDKTYPVEGGSY